MIENSQEHIAQIILHNSVVISAEQSLTITKHEITNSSEKYNIRCVQ